MTDEAARSVGDTAPADGAVRTTAPSRKPYLIAFVLGAIAVTVTWPLMRRVPPPPSVTGGLPDFALVDQTGASCDASALRGTTWLVSLVSARHAATCARALSDLRVIQARLVAARADVRLLVVSVDYDPTLETLRALAAQLGGDVGRMRILGGSLDARCALVRAAFPPPSGAERAACDALEAVAQHPRVAILDARGGFRGDYPVTHAGLEEVFFRVLRVWDETTP